MNVWHDVLTFEFYKSVLATEKYILYGTMKNILFWVFLLCTNIQIWGVVVLHLNSVLNLVR